MSRRVRSSRASSAQLARRDLGPEVCAERPEQLDRRGRVRPRDVVRDLGEVAERRDAGRRDLELERGDERRRARAACRPVRPATSPRSRPGAASVPMIGTGRVCGTAAGIAPRLIHWTTPSRPARSMTSAVKARQR